jgi:hypothetical protein
VFGTALGLNIAAGDQYIALLLPTRLYREEFGRRGLAPENLSRAVGDAGIVTSALVPWNSCGAYMSVMLGVSTMAYLPFAVFNWTAPLLTLLLGITGWKVTRLPVESGPGSMVRVKLQDPPATPEQKGLSMHGRAGATTIKLVCADFEEFDRASRGVQGRYLPRSRATSNPSNEVRRRGSGSQRRRRVPLQYPCSVPQCRRGSPQATTGVGVPAAPSIASATSSSTSTPCSGTSMRAGASPSRSGLLS